GIIPTPTRSISVPATTARSSAPRMAARAGRRCRCPARSSTSTRWPAADFIFLSPARGRGERYLLVRGLGLRFAAEQAGEAEAPLPAGVDADRRRRAGAQRRLAGMGQQAQLDRQALHHLDPIARGVLRRQDRELRAGRRAHAL